MFRLAVLACGTGLAALSVPAPAHAQYGSPYGYGYPSGPAQVRNVQCERQKSTDGTAGALVGAVVGGLIGGAIGNNIDNDRTYTQYRRHGPPRVYKESRSNSGQVAVGATLGALAGGMAGSSMAKSSGGDCQVAYAPSYNYSASPYGSIPQSTQGLYGGAEVMRGGSYYPQQMPQQYPASAYPSYPAPSPVYQAPAQAPYQYGGGQTQYGTTYGNTAYGGNNCQVIHRETRMPDGQTMRDPVTACLDSRTGQWRIQDGWEEELYGY